MTADGPTFDDLVLVAIHALDGGKPPTLAKIVKDLRPFLDDKLSAKDAGAAIGASVAAAVDAGLAFTKRAPGTKSYRYELGTVGIAALRTAYPDVPVTGTFGELMQATIFVRALDAMSLPSQRLTKNYPLLRAALLLREHGLELGARQTMSLALDAVCAKILGSNGSTKPAIIQSMIRSTLKPSLRRPQPSLVREPETLPVRSKSKRSTPRKAVGATAIDAAAVVPQKRTGARGESSLETTPDAPSATTSAPARTRKPPRPREATGTSNAPKRAKTPRKQQASEAPTSFASEVMALAERLEHGRWGDDKVFINHVYEALAEKRPDLAQSLDAFKLRLLEENNAHRLTLSQADLIEAMPAGDVRASRVETFGQAYHFIVTESR